MKYENEDGGNKSDVRGSVGSFMKASIIVLDGLLCLVAAVESHFALSSLSHSLPLSLPPFLSLFLSQSPFLPLVSRRRLSSATLSLTSSRCFLCPLASLHPVLCPRVLCPLRFPFSTETPTGTSARFAREFGSLSPRREGTLSCLL